jgi:hypothetical protein
MTGDGELRHGEPQGVRNDRRGFDKYRWPAGSHWPRGLELTIYDDGRVKVGGWHTSAMVLDVSSFRTGSSNPSGHVIARFQPAPGHDHATDVGVAEDSDDDESSSRHLDHPADADHDLGDEDAYERETWAAIEECKHLKRRYDPAIWAGMVRQSGAVAAARHLLVSGDIQYGFRRLIEEGRPDLTVEWSVLLPRWRRLFSEQYRAAARWRLQQAGVQPPEDTP